MTQVEKLMDDLVECSIESPVWIEHSIETLASIAVKTSFKFLKISIDWKVSILACDDQRIVELNNQFRGKKKPTNVLSWPSYDMPLPSKDLNIQLPSDLHPEDRFLGDIALSYETILKESKEANIAFEAHVTHLIVHGLLHLLGFDHDDDSDADLMEEIESQILVELGINNPYARKS